MEYTKPMIVDYGDLTELTASSAGGGCFDDAFQAGQPVPPSFQTACAGP
jgi:hypothetical protein